MVHSRSWELGLFQFQEFLLQETGKSDKLRVITHINQHVDETTLDSADNIPSAHLELLMFNSLSVPVSGNLESYQLGKFRQSRNEHSPNTNKWPGNLSHEPTHTLSDVCDHCKWCYLPHTWKGFSCLANKVCILSSHWLFSHEMSQLTQISIQMVKCHPFEWCQIFFPDFSRTPQWDIPNCTMGCSQFSVEIFPASQ